MSDSPREPVREVFDPCPVSVCVCRHATGQVCGEVAVRGLAQGESGPGRNAWGQPIDPVDAPVATFDVPADQIPALAGVYEPVRLYRADRGRPAVAEIVKAKLVLIAARAGNSDEGFRVDSRAGRWDRLGHCGQQIDPMPQTGRQQLFEFGKGPYLAESDDGWVRRARVD